MSRSAAHVQRNSQSRALFSSCQRARDVLPTTKATIAARMQALNLQYHVDDIPNSNGAKLHWLGDQSAKKLLLYFHGGGFALPPVDGHVTFLVDSVNKVREQKGQSVVIGFLEYTLSNVAKFPVQHLQAVQALRYALGKGYEPSDIVMGGDSAGGNMSLGLISHILHPMGGLPPLSLAGPLAGVLLISPWCGFDEDTASAKENAETDVCAPELLREMRDAFIRPEDRNNWSEAYLANSSWWKGFPAGSVLSLFGEQEMLRDHIAKLNDTLQEAGVNVTSVECSLHVHVDCVLDATAGLAYGVMATEIWDWLGKLL